MIFIVDRVCSIQGHIYYIQWRLAAYAIQGLVLFKEIRYVHLCISYKDYYTDCVLYKHKYHKSQLEP